jgi:hypothetical protein
MVRGAEPRLGPAPNERLGADFSGFHPTDEDLSVWAPGLLLGRAPPARGLPLLVVKGRASPPSPRKGREELERPAPE